MVIGARRCSVVKVGQGGEGRRNNEEEKRESAGTYLWFVLKATSVFLSFKDSLGKISPAVAHFGKAPLFEIFVET